MTIFDEGLAGVIDRDPRYAYEAYEFIFHALHYTQKKLGKYTEEPREEGAANPENHVTGRELLEGARDLALQEFGLMARTVFQMWGIHKTEDFGHIVFNLIEAGLMSKTDRDTLDDFRDVYDMDEALVKGFQIKLDEV